MINFCLRASEPLKKVYSSYKALNNIVIQIKGSVKARIIIDAQEVLTADIAILVLEEEY